MVVILNYVTHLGSSIQAWGLSDNHLPIQGPKLVQGKEIRRTARDDPTELCTEEKHRDASLSTTLATPSSAAHTGSRRAVKLQFMP